MYFFFFSGSLLSSLFGCAPSMGFFHLVPPARTVADFFLEFQSCYLGYNSGCLQGIPEKTGIHTVLRFLTAFQTCLLFFLSSWSSQGFFLSFFFSFSSTYGCYLWEDKLLNTHSFLLKAELCNLFPILGGLWFCLVLPSLIPTLLELAWLNFCFFQKL